MPRNSGGLDLQADDRRGKAQPTKRRRLMTSGSGFSRFRSGCPKSLIVAVVVTGLVIVVVGLFLFIGYGGYTWRSEVRVH